MVMKTLMHNILHRIIERTPSQFILLKPYDSLCQIVICPLFPYRNPSVSWDMFGYPVIT